MTPLELTLTIFGTMMGFAIPLAIFAVVLLWAINKWS